jgi:predicted porin
MKKSLLAILILGTFAGSALAQSSVTIYGVVDAGFSRNDTGTAKTTNLDSGLQSGSRLGFKGTEDLGGGNAAVFTLENGFSVDTGTQTQGALFGRQAYVGLTGTTWGALKLGRQYIELRKAMENIDPFGVGLAGNAENFFLTPSRADNTLSYETPNMSGFSGLANYSFGENTAGSSVGRQFGASVTYSNGPIYASLGHHRRNLFTGTAPAATNNGKAETTQLGGTYDFTVAKVHAAFAWNKDEAASGAKTVDSRDLLLGVSAPVGPGKLLASYILKDDKLANNDSKLWAIGYTYDLSKRTNLYTSYGSVKNDGNALTRGTNNLGLGVGNNSPAIKPTVAGEDPTTFNIGVRHKF